MNVSLRDSGTLGFYPRASDAFSSRSYGSYRASERDFVARFYELVKRWRRETLVISSIDQAIAHEAFQEIVEMGGAVVPLIIREIKTRPDLLVAALPMITREDPVSEQSRGDVVAMATDWIDWHQRG